MNKKLISAVAAAAVVLVIAVSIMIARRSRPAASSPAAAGSVSLLAAEARRLESQQNLKAAKETYEKLVADFFNAREVADWQKKIEEINIKFLFSSEIVPGSVEYQVQPGDSLEKIARDHKTTVEMIRKSNGIEADAIFPGQKIKVWNSPFSIVVDKSQNTLFLKNNEEIVKTYTVATGANNSTPVGTFTIIDKIANPPWYKPGQVVPPGSPENILGTRWLGINKPGYGIHGTTDPKSLGTQVTAGCVRMSNRDVEELFTIVPKGTEVSIID
jgi:lipoprotein-anchoring transpeptidase ErfK/SrfK